MTYRISSFRRLCSVTSPGRVAKSASKAAIRERRFSITLLMAAVSCKRIGQRSASNGNRMVRTPWLV